MMCKNACPKSRLRRDAGGYDPALGRWGQQDPVIKEHESPYTWVTSNPVRFSDLMGLDTFNININQADISRITVENSTNHFYNLYSEGELVTSYNLNINEFGLVEFPAHGLGFGRYAENQDPAEVLVSTSSKDCQNGEVSTTYTNIGPGDHHLKPDAAAALFGLATEMYLDDSNFRVDFGDMSNEWGMAPGNDHQTHGGPKGYSGQSIDYRYLNNNNQSYQGTATSDKFHSFNNTMFVLSAQAWGFNKNYISNQQAGWNVKVKGKNIIRVPGASQINYHNDHGHLTYTGNK